MEASGAADDEAHDGVEALSAGVVDAQSDRGEDPVAVLADGLGGLDECGQAGAAGAGDPSVDQLGDGVGVEVAGEDGAEGLLQRVGTPDVASAAFELAQGGGLVIGEVAGVLEQCPAGSFELLRRCGVAAVA